MSTKFQNLDQISESKVEKSWKKLKKKIEKKVENIARGTTDPGYRVYNLNYLIDFVFI